MILNDRQIRELCTHPYNATVAVGSELRRTVVSGNGAPMIEPFIGSSIKQVDGTKVISYGLSSFGYDVRLANKFKLFNKPNDGRILDIKNIDESMVCEEIEGDSVVIPPGCLLLGHTVETFNMPRSVMAICMGKSTLARCGAECLITPIEPGFRGQVVIEIVNGSGLPLKIYANEGIAQLVFLANEEGCETSYADRGGKYQNQTGVVTSKL